MANKSAPAFITVAGPVGQVHIQDLKLKGCSSLLNVERSGSVKDLILQDADIEGVLSGHTKLSEADGKALARLLAAQIETCKAANKEEPQRRLDLAPKGEWLSKRLGDTASVATIIASIKDVLFK